MKRPRGFRMRAGEATTDVLVGAGALSALGTRLPRIARGRWFLITSEPVFARQGARLLAGAAEVLDPEPLLVPDGERAKTWSVLGRLLSELMARGLSNAELDCTIRDLTGVDIRPSREFPVDPANEAGFDNSGESLGMSPALLKKYLEAARRVADFLVLTPHGLEFAPHPVVADTDRDRYSVNRSIMSAAFDVAASIAVMRAACSAATDSSIPR